MIVAVYRARQEQTMPMNPNRIQTVFLLAVEATDAAARALILERECGTDAELRQRVEVLLFPRTLIPPAGFLDKSPLSPVSTVDEPACERGVR